MESDYLFRDFYLEYLSESMFKLRSRFFLPIGFLEPRFHEFAYCNCQSCSAFTCEQLAHVRCHLHVTYPVGVPVRISNGIRLRCKDVKAGMTILELWQRSITYSHFTEDY